jgi:hypothetical protein
MADAKEADPMEPTKASLPDTDRPIATDEEDRFGRTRLADSVATDISSGTGSLVAAVVGPWGSGKTSVLQLVRGRLDKNDAVVPIDFNPWLFAGTDQLIQAYFAELVAQLASNKDVKIQTAAKRIEEYSDLLDPFGDLPGIGGAFKAGGKGLRLFGRKIGTRAKFHATSIDAQKKQIEAALSATNKRFVVFIDDIDRLEQDEVRDMVRLVRLVADFPRVSYLIAFDRKRVEEALGRGDPAIGRDYLEKIVQLSYPVPIPTRQALDQVAFVALDAVINGSRTRPLDQAYWGRVWQGAIEPLLRTPRDVVRYTNAVRASLRAFGEEINLVDILALEAYRVLLPDTFERLTGLVPALTTVGSGVVGLNDPLDRRKEEFKAALQAVSADAGDRAAAVAQLLELLFPATKGFLGNWLYGPEQDRRWRAERRVANREVLGIYLSHVLPVGATPTALVERFFSALTDRAALEEFLEGMTDQELGPLFERLADYEFQFPDDPGAAILALDSVRHRLPPGGPILFTAASAERRLEFLLLRLLRKPSDEGRREDVLRRVLPEIRSLSSRWWLIFNAGRRENWGDQLISEPVQNELENELWQTVRNTPASELANERELLRILHFLKEADATSAQPVIDAVVGDDAALVGLLASGLAENASQDSEGRVKRIPRLAWSTVEGLVPDAVMAGRLAQLADASEAIQTDGQRVAVELGKRYAGGWRPPAFGADDEDE